MSEQIGQELSQDTGGKEGVSPYSFSTKPPVYRGLLFPGCSLQNRAIAFEPEKSCSSHNASGNHTWTFSAPVYVFRASLPWCQKLKTGQLSAVVYLGNQRCQAVPTSRHLA